MGRTFAIGDIHGDLESLFRLLSRLPTPTSDDSLVFLGDYLDNGPKSAEVVAYLRRLPRETPAKVVTLRGNHEDSWLRVVDEGFAEFVLPHSNGCTATLHSFMPPAPTAKPDDGLSKTELRALLEGTFFPPDVLAWLRELPLFHEDDHALYVHAGLTKGPDGAYEHPARSSSPKKLMWCRDRAFVEGYRGKLVVFGHTLTKHLPPELSDFTPEDAEDAWQGDCVIGIDTGCGKSGFLTGLELPSMRVYESR
ncbi:MAG: serine/threonine protein phosphatase [Polyangiaceae bacterium]|nr:serine/threonine protein phosphatase [Polyangiaceae bacterium]